MDKPKILLVDDREANLMTLESLLTDMDVELTSVTSGRKAVNAATRCEYALIVLDVMMPNMDGFQTAGLIRSLKTNAHTPIIFVTAINREQKYVFKGYDAGAIDYIFKPIEAHIFKNKVKVLLNIHRQKCALEQANAEKDELNQKLQEFIGIVSHDLRNPLSSIYSFCSLCLDDDNWDEDEVKECIQLMQETSCRGLDMVKELLDLTALGSGKLTLKISDVDPCVLLEQAVSETTHHFKRKNLQLIQAMSPGLKVKADSSRIMQVLINLITNAVKFSSPGQAIEIGCREEHNRVLIWVKDQGIGIPEVMIPQLFDPRKTCSRRGTAGEQGTGYGLPLSNDIVKLHGSQITVSSRDQQGSQFSFSLAKANNGISSPLRENSVETEFPL